MNTEARRQSLALAAAATSAVVLLALVPRAGAVEPLDGTSPVTSVVAEVLDQAAPIVGEEPTTTTTSTTAPTVATSTTSSTVAPAPTTTAPASTGGVPQTRRGTPGPAPVSVGVSPESGVTASIPKNPAMDLLFPTLGVGDADFPLSGTLLPGSRSTVDVIALLQGVGAPPSLVAKVLAPFPVAGAASYSDDWDAPRHGGRRHEGTDIFATRGTPVIAAVDGVVGNLTTTGLLGGTSLRVTAATGTYVYYAHLDRFAPGITDGTLVSAGDVVGFIGNTGNAIFTPPHLHFEIHPAGGAPVPPVPYLDRWLADARVAASAVAGAPAVDALVRPARSANKLPSTADPTEALMAAASSSRHSLPIDPAPLAVLGLFPAAWFARRGLRAALGWMQGLLG